MILTYSLTKFDGVFFENLLISCINLYIRPSHSAKMIPRGSKSGKRTNAYNRRNKYYKLTEVVTPTTEPLTYINFQATFYPEPLIPPIQKY